MSRMSRMSNRTFGIELEVVGISIDAAVTALRRAGFDAESGAYSSRNREGVWLVKPDGSVSGAGGACEVVSPVLSGEEGIASAVRAVGALRSAGATVNSTCGFHVHVGIADFDVAAMKRLVKTWVKYEDSIDALLAPSRRGNRNYYCQSVTYFIAGTPSESSPEAMNAAARRAFKLIDRCRTVNDLCYLIRTRYVKLNLVAYYRHSTVEIRAHQGTVNPKKVEAWVRLCVGLVDAAKAAHFVLQRTSFARPDETAVERVDRLIRFARPGASASLFLRRRAAELNQGAA